MRPLSAGGCDPNAGCLRSCGTPDTSIQRYSTVDGALMPTNTQQRCGFNGGFGLFPAAWWGATGL